MELHSQLQRTVAFSTAEAEYMSAADAVKDTQGLMHLLQEIGLTTTSYLRLYMDNTAAKAMAESTASGSRTRHIAVRYHFIRDLVSKGELNILHVPSSKQLADVLTKPLSAPSFGPAALRLLGCTPIANATSSDLFLHTQHTHGTGCATKQSLLVTHSGKITATE